MPIKSLYLQGKKGLFHGLDYSVVLLCGARTYLYLFHEALSVTSISSALTANLIVCVLH